MQSSPIKTPIDPGSDEREAKHIEDQAPKKIGNFWALLTLAGFMLGTFSGYFVNERRHIQEHQTNATQEAHAESEMAKITRQVNPPEGYILPAKFGDVGPKLLDAGAMNYEAFLQVYDQGGAPLTEAQMAILTKGSEDRIVINQQNAYFLLNFFWALGLTNRNPILTEGPMVTNSQGKIENFASTGGWSLAAKPIRELYASADIIQLAPEQQERLENVAQNVFRPCCNNPTHFPDCNHGMAMLGLLQLMVSQGASEDELFEAAKYVNAFWYPSQNLGIATFFKAAEDIDYADADARLVVSRAFSSGSGFQDVHQWLATNGLLQQGPSGSGGCGV